MGKGNAPKPPSPYKTANAQARSNIKTAVAQTNLNQVDQVNPDGSLKYTQIGTNADGTPKYQATTTLSGANQSIYDTNKAADLGLAQLAQSGAQQLQQPFSLDNDAVEARLMELGRKRLDPLLRRRAQADETDLINRGIRPGSTSYDRARDNRAQGENDAYNQLLLTGRSQAVSEALAGRSQLFNETMGARTGSQVQSPQFANTPQTGVGGTDVAGLIQNDYNTRAGQYQQQQSDMWGGLFGLGRAAIGMFSDKRLKKNIKATGAKVRGVPVKTWEWKGSGKPDVGVIAQDVARKHPEYVDRTDPSGFLKVDYGRLMRGAVR